MGAMNVFYIRGRRSKISLSFFKVLVIASICFVPLFNYAQNPSASFTSNKFTGCSPLTVDFTNLSTQATNYVWNFGNGNTSTLQDPTTVYITSGYYTVMLVAINSLTGGRDTLIATNYINVVDNPSADFSASPTTSCLSGNLITFTNLSVNANQYTWDFGDGNSSNLPNPTHSFASAGTYTVKLLAKNPWGCKDVIVKQSIITILPNPAGNFQSTPRSTCDVMEVFNFTCNTSGVIGYEWDFGDGTTSTLQNPTNVYGATGTYDVTLILTGSNGCVDTITKPSFINIGSSLVPSFDVNTQVGCPPLTIDFNCTVGDAITWVWDFGDGTSSNSQSPSHIYSSPGSYAITLTVTTSSGCNGTVSMPGYIVVDDVPLPSFTLTNPVGCIPYDGNFVNTSTGGSSYIWDFGDGFTSTNVNPIHTYDDTGTYDVTLTVISANGCQADTTIEGAVSVNTLNANFNGTPRVGCPPLPVVLNDNSSPAAVNWQWDLGDGSTANTASVNHIYTLLGNYNVTLIATSAAGCTDTITKNNFFRVVDGNPSYAVPDTILVCTPPGSVSFADPTLGSNYWSWHFGDGDSANVKNPGHTYTTPGVYTVTLTTAIAGGCVQVYNPYAIIEVLPFDVSPIQSITISNCQPYQVQFTDTTSGVISYFWEFGDGTTDTTANPLHTYSQPGTYTVTAQITSVNGCMSSLSTTVTLGHQNPIIVSSSKNCTGDTIQFSLNSAAFASAIWDFGDGNTSTQLMPSHIYNTVGNYQVTVILTDTAACVDTFYFSPVKVGDPQPSFYEQDPVTGCVTLKVKFINTSTGANSYLWDFGIGTTSTVTNPTKNYGSPGVYSVTLTATGNGCSRSITKPNLITANGATANFNFSQTNNCMPVTATFNDMSTNPVSWFWDFGDGTTSNLQSPVHIYSNAPTAGVSLTIVDINGCSKTKTKTNISFVLPTVTADDTSGCRPHTVNFSSSTNALAYLWDFGDGTTGNGATVSHLFSDTGLFDITLSCVLASGCTTTVTLQDYIDVNAPVADFSSPVQAGCAPTVVNFNNISSGDAVSYLWSFGDGSTSTTTDPTNLYANPGTYTVTLVATDTLGCTDTITKPDYITIPGPVSQFTLASQINCLQTFVQFTDQSSNAVTWSWNFGDGYTSVLQNPSHTYQDTGSYIVSLITTDSIGCTSYFVSPNPVTVYPDPTASATASITSGCGSLAVTFTNNSIGGTGYVWHFGNGDSSNANAPIYTYSIPGVYYPYIVAINQFGCRDTFLLADSIVVKTQPVAKFSRSPVSGCQPLGVTFTNNSSGLQQPTYLWNFGTGQTSNSVSPAINIQQVGTFNVTLYVTNANGCSDSITKSVTVKPRPNAAGVLSDQGGCSPHIINFTDLSTNAVSWLWDFGNGNTSTQQNPSQVYTQGGIYNISLVVTGQNGCKDTNIFNVPVSISQTPEAIIAVSQFQGCQPFNVSFTSNSLNLVNESYQWDFGNGQSSAQSAFNASYNIAGVFPVSLVVTNAGGCSDTANVQINSYQPASAQASASNTTGCSPLSVSFNNSSSGSQGYLWDFGDGNTSSDSIPTHLYQNAGSYTVTLTVYGQGGCNDTLTLPQQIVVNPTPSSSFSHTVSDICSPVTVSFNNSSSVSGPSTYNWDFGDGSTSQSANPSIVYSTGGTYNVVLTVIENGGCSDTAMAIIAVGQSPTAIAAPLDSLGCSETSLSFVDQSVNANSILWVFGDGNTSTQPSVSHIYSGSGIYYPYLVAYNNSGCTDTLILGAVNVRSKPQASFTVNSQQQCFGGTFVFTNTSVPPVGLTYDWDIGGITTQAENPQITFTNPGIYGVTLIVVNPDGCSDTISDPYYLQMYDSVPPPVSPINSVSVIANDKVEIIWQNSAALDLGEYRLFRLDNNSGVFNLIYTDTSPANSSMSVTSKFIDSGLNTLNSSYTYKLQTVDFCSNFKALSQSVPHTTINITAVSIVGGIAVSWTPYQGCQVGGYELSRTELSSGVTSLVAIVPPNQYNYTDSTVYCPDDYNYRVMATSLCGSTYTSNSDTSVARPVNILSGQKVEVVRSTVINDSEVLTEWLPPSIAPDRVVGYEIYRSDDKINFKFLANLSPFDFSYIDYNVDVHSFNYYYKVIPLNDCNLSGTSANNSSSILLKSKSFEYESKLWWTQYDEWDTGVDYYLIESEDATGNWVPVIKVPGSVLEYKIK